MATHSIRQFPLHFPWSASPWAITFQLHSTSYPSSPWVSKFRTKLRKGYDTSNFRTHRTMITEWLRKLWAVTSHGGWCMTNKLRFLVNDQRDAQFFSMYLFMFLTLYISVSQTVVLGFCRCGPFRLNISPKKTEKIKLTWIAYHTL